MTVQSEAYMCRYLIAGIMGLNPAEGMDACLLCWLYAVYVAASDELILIQRSPTGGVCVIVSDVDMYKMRWHRPKLGFGATTKKMMDKLLKRIMGSILGGEAQLHEGDGNSFHGLSIAIPVQKVLRDVSEK